MLVFLERLTSFFSDSSNTAPSSVFLLWCALIDACINHVDKLRNLQTPDDQLANHLCMLDAKSLWHSPQSLLALPTITSLLGRREGSLAALLIKPTCSKPYTLLRLSSFHHLPPTISLPPSPSRRRHLPRNSGPSRCCKRRLASHWRTTYPFMRQVHLRPLAPRPLGGVLAHRQMQ
ncbi:hypothetical protein OH77DRAFT_1271533 [Trametes cingulata]|nr:hypothetical protein OH77DRAFT_1271533 [Trametes cingulata]